MTVPTATARLQLHKDFSFAHAIEVLPYYAALGISHIYSSPILTARSGSTHGYDIVDPTRVNAELGGEAGLRLFVAAIRQAGMGLILDIVPNHMGIGAENPWWQHVLEWGEESPYARWFDIEWHPADEILDGKVMAPFLGQPYGDALAAGEIRLEYNPTRGKFFLAYYTHSFPIAPPDYLTILQTAASELLHQAVAAFDAGRNEQGVLPQQNVDAGIALLRELGSSEEGLTAIQAAVAAFAPDTPQGREALHSLLERQHYRLAWWRCAADGINWRRFFEVTDLVGVRVEQDDVFEATHALIFRLYTEGLIDGVRIDHVDGLADPGAYCRKLRNRLRALSSQRPTDLPPAPAYIIAEKILAHQESLRLDWEIDGTSGYDFMDRAGALLHDPAGEAPLSALWMRCSGRALDFPAEVRQARRQLLANNLSGEFESAARALHAVAHTDLRTRDFSLGAIRRVYAELLTHFPVYRTYVDDNGGNELDRQVIEHTLESARQSVERTEIPLLEVVACWLAGDPPRDPDNPRVRFLMQRAITRFQQLTPPLAAKSVEDTAFYRYGRLLSRNEVGSDPCQFAISIDAFHEANRQRALLFPNSLLATATHDHKRGEDLRARLAVLSECHADWEACVQEWMQINAGCRRSVPEESGAPPAVAPHPADELMLYQMLAGAWPVGLKSDDCEGVMQFAARLERWQTKALREAKQVSDWVSPNEEYEAACREFLFAILDGAAQRPFLERLAALIERITPAGIINSLAQAVLRMTSPGIPDLYQGTDLWDFSLVDPDNRRAVDHALRADLLLQYDSPITGMTGWESGWLKQQIVCRTLQLRAREPELFLRGSYVPLQITGPHAGHVVAFARRLEDRTILVMVTHLAASLLGNAPVHLIPSVAWEGTRAAVGGELPSCWQDIYTGTVITTEAGLLELGTVLALLPVAVLESR
ncbi:malto-oligosyltrehalose synthase [Janthinobacterium sp. 17J80-10]|nr:malto-oligosyltrehalose synthase [Janthinobacterium sp. 17J80-10]